ncbi:glutamyl-tRNA reductase [Lentiprolixibacter aurantiacus]|uniref:Glutamyl-tRNA reductase n=1 Tax=Lentiprolixibacter aurantiacus TaxID=2993939 RepID=A0AAE3MMW3_9FLAO|nr:glutamyl-tRNA reductase [Lentiprolixibacter aurantiacus]MCX2720378.1 glutamyl-tRNA reductase [Lentiprolixibacter aurantiacus]
MPKILRYVSISHKSASVGLREQFHISESKKGLIMDHLCERFPDISGLLLLVTCNRTEVYFESKTTTSALVQEELISLKCKQDPAQFKNWFTCNDHTKASVKHLLKVSSGLESKVLGDAEIIHQIKKAYLFSMERQLQGSLLERAMQTVFRSHKRISNETNYRDGTTSVAYKSLKVIDDIFPKESSRTKRILFIGAGDIVVQLFKYNSKFGFSNIHISNRTEEKARNLASLYQGSVYPWQKVLDNDFRDFDVVISAVSNYPQLIKNIHPSSSRRILIDLGMPCNISKGIEGGGKLICYDLDTIAQDLQENRNRRMAAIVEVEEILDNEVNAFMQWFQMASLRNKVVQQKEMVFKKVQAYLAKELQSEEPETAEMLTNQVIKKMFSESESFNFPSKEIDALIADQASILLKTSF